MTYSTDDIIEKVILVGLDCSENSLTELKELAYTSGCEVLATFTQNRDKPHSGHYLGKGKISELKELMDELGASGIICDDELKSVQLKNLSNMLETKVMDRTLLILDIFAKRAKSAEGKIQVEISQLKYNLSRLSGLGISLSRLGGGIGTRGPGEKKLEMDRRNIRTRINDLEKELLEIKTHRKTLRDSRKVMPIISLVGYTNAGKSTLMNALTDARVLAEDKLFATLDTTTRKLVLQNSSEEVLLTDTVGFIKKLPASLVKAFRSTFEELQFSDILLHVVDASDIDYQNQMQTVYDALKDINSTGKPIITIFNKIDKINQDELYLSDPQADHIVKVSAITNLNLDKLKNTLELVLKSLKKSTKLFIPHTEGRLLNMLFEKSQIVEKTYLSDGIEIEAFLNVEMLSRAKDYIITNISTSSN